jgi:catechol 2,3-dioxygenase-like lactoylglutathione lyase family enzyme
VHPPISQSITFTYTDDLDRASGFFREIMELELVLDQGPCHIYRLTETSFIGVCNLPDRPTDAAGVTITIVSDDVDGWRDFLESKGLVYQRLPARSERFRIYSSLFVSPHGYRIEIQRFDDPSWHQPRSQGPVVPGAGRT